jgi:DNA-binding transcriptional LysR family regulator
MDHLNIDALRTFTSIIDLNGFNKAADKVNRTQSAVSMQMKKLEEMTGHGLFERSGKKYFLTNQGEVLLSYARKIIHLNDEVFLALKDSKLKGKVRVGIQIDFAESPLPKTLIAFARKYPEVLMDLKIDTSDVLQQQLIAGKLDIVIYLAQDTSGELQSHVLGTFPLKWIYSPPYNISTLRKPPLPLAMLGPNCKIRQIASLALNNAGISWRIVFTSSSLPATWSALDAGIGISARTTIGLPPSLKIIPAKFGLPELPAVYAYLCTTGKNDSVVVLHLKNYLLQTLKEKSLTLYF